MRFNLSNNTSLFTLGRQGVLKTTPHCKNCGISFEMNDIIFSKLQHKMNRYCVVCAVKTNQIDQSNLRMLVQRKVKVL